MIWTLLQIFVDLALVAGSTAMWWRLRRPPQDDPRLSRGLQLLQTKITILEDLSDRTDAQVKQLTSLLDHKARGVQNKILEAEQQIMKIDHSMSKSLEVAEIFQDKIPHQEILERQRTVEYVKAARMAHSGLSIDEISEAVHLPREQIELIAKFNREQLMFDETQLPEWASRPGEESATQDFSLNNVDFVSSGFGAGLEMTKPEPTQPDLATRSKIQEDFRRAVESARQFEQNPPPSVLETKVAETLRASMNTGLETVQPAVMSIKATAQTFKDKLVATAEDLLRPQNTVPTVKTTTDTKGAMKFATTNSAPTAKVIPSLKLDSSAVKKVVFPKIEKGP
jgi:hypothetical protein